MAFLKNENYGEIISVNIGDVKFNFRACCVIFNEDRSKVLVNYRDGIDFVVLPGGRVRTNESTEETLVREIQSGLNETVVNLHLKLVMENFFKWRDGVIVHELQYFYSGKFKNKTLESVKGEIVSDNGRDKFKWLTIQELYKHNYVPTVAIKYIQELQRKDYEIKHQICDEVGM